MHCACSTRNTSRKSFTEMHFSSLFFQMRANRCLQSMIFRTMWSRMDFVQKLHQNRKVHDDQRKQEKIQNLNKKIYRSL